MLDKSRISKIGMTGENGDFSIEWKQARIAKFTSSQMYKLCGEKGLGESGTNYIRSRVFESISKVSSDNEISTYATASGLVEEGFALQELGRVKGWKSIVTQKLIYGIDPHFTSTPDAIFVRKESIDETKYDVCTIEVKCFQAEHHMEMIECETPADIKAKDKKIYWQVISQMDVVDCLVGYLVFFHPALPIDKGGLRIIEFRKLLLGIDFRLINTRKEMALQEFERIKTKISNIKN